MKLSTRYHILSMYPTLFYAYCLAFNLYLITMLSTKNCNLLHPANLRKLMSRIVECVCIARCRSQDRHRLVLVHA